jgi:hypothetical protein
MPRASLHFDPICKVPWGEIDNPGNENDYFFSYSDTSTVRETLTLADTMGIAGLMLWEINGGWLQDAPAWFPASKYPNLVRDPLLQAVKRTAAKRHLLKRKDPTLSVNTGAISFGKTWSGTPSAEQSYVLSGASLEPSAGRISAIAPEGFQISKTSGTGFVSSLSIGYKEGFLEPTVLYVRFTPTEQKKYHGIIKHRCGNVLVGVAASGSGISDRTPAVMLDTVSVCPITWEPTQQWVQHVGDYPDRYLTVFGSCDDSLGVDSVVMIALERVKLQRLTQQALGAHISSSLFGLVRPPLGPVQLVAYHHSGQAIKMSSAVWYHVNQQRPVGAIKHRNTPWNSGVSLSVGGTFSGKAVDYVVTNGSLSTITSAPGAGQAGTWPAGQPVLSSYKEGAETVTFNWKFTHLGSDYFSSWIETAFSLEPQ